ncbi:histidine phosphatase family protein [Hyphomicrobium sp.]|jgi:phosphohistidine phosphatase SixA|uniref:SixA phosphatase family protein n=1 Tax=Hyphomicrobium sp. TaxID=82 RepID=UPI0035692D3D
MKRFLTYRHVVAIVFLIAATAFGANIGTEAIGGSYLGLLAVGFPQLGKSEVCGLCTPTREQASDYAPVDHVMGGPKRIILLRHADKTDDPSNEDLSDAGVERAKRLATYIPETFGKPDIIIATAHSKHSNRPKETMEPLADALGLKIQHDFENKEFADLVDEIFNDPDYKNKTIVICWHHGNLPAMAALLGVPAGSYPDPWPDDAFGLILDLQYDPYSGSPPKVTRVTEPF